MSDETRDPDDLEQRNDTHCRSVRVTCFVWINIGSDEEPDWKFDEEAALAVLLAEEVIFTNTHWWKKSWPLEAQKTLALCVLCNDVFAWGCADAEDLHRDEIRDLYEHWEKDPNWGAAIWCIKKRNHMPQKPVEDAIRRAGIWDLDALGVASNTIDAEVTAFVTGVAPALRSRGGA